MKRQTLLLALITVGLVACQSSQTGRIPSSIQDHQLLVDYYEKRVQLDQVMDRIADLHRTSKNTSAESGGYPKMGQPEYEQAQNLINQRTQLQAQVADLYPKVAAQLNSNVPVSVKIPYSEAWRRHHDEIILHDLAPFALKNNQPVKKMFLSTDATKSFYLQLTNFVFSWKPTPESPHELPGKPKTPFLVAELSCNHDAVIHAWPSKIKAPAGEAKTFRWYDTKFNAQRPYIEITNPETTCDFKFSDPEKPGQYGIRLIPEAVELTRIGSPQLESEVCYLPKTDHLDPMDQFFLSPKIPYLTCPIKVDDVQTLEESTEGINAKIRALTGKNLTDEFMKKGDPFAPMDFSQAPKLDAILISYLVFRADFGGNTIMRALRHHAEKGTLIRIALSDVITLRKDRQMLLDFQSEFPNVKLLLYKYKPQGKGVKDWFSSFHRTNHIKLFLTYSQSQPRANKVILGGRNIHDGFVFDQPSSNYIYPTVVDYSPNGDESWARWEDFETLFTSTSLVKTIMGQFFSVLHADYATVHIRSYSESVETQSPLNPAYLNLKDNEIYLRSLVSVPFKDNHLLEKTFINMIDSAQKVIKVSTPYFNLTEGLLQAFSRASDRGVDIQLITRLDLDGDTADIVLSDVNKKSVNKLIDKIKIYEYTTQGKILHSKLFLIDNKFVMMGSVNLNLRSFFHDIENATLVYGPGFNRKIDTIFEQYKTESKLLTEKQKTTFWKRILIGIIGTAL